MSLSAQARAKRSVKVEKACQLIIAGRTQSDAYRMIFKPKKAKAKTIHDMASKFFKDPDVTHRLAELLEPIKAQTKLTAERWQEEIDRCALMDVRKLFDTHGNPIDIPNLGDDEAACVAGFEIVEEFSGKGEDRVPVGYTRKFKLTDKLRALELAGKTRGYYTEKREITGVVTVEHLVNMIKRKEPKVING